MNIPTLRNNKSIPSLSNFRKSRIDFERAEPNIRILQNKLSLREAAANIRLPKLKEKISSIEHKITVKKFFKNLMEHQHIFKKLNITFLKSSAPHFKFATNEQKEESARYSKILIRCIQDISITAKELIDLIQVQAEQQRLESRITNEEYEILFNGLNNILVVGSSVLTVLNARNLIQGEESFYSNRDLDLYAPCTTNPLLAYKIQNLVEHALATKIIQFLQQKLDITANNSIKIDNYYGNGIQHLDKPYIYKIIQDKLAIINCARQLIRFSFFNNEPSANDQWLLIQVSDIDLKIGCMSRPYAFLADSLYVDCNGKIDSFETTVPDAFEKSLIALQTKSLSMENMSTSSEWIWKFALKKIRLGWDLNSNTRQHIFESTQISLSTIRKIISSFKTTIYEETKLENIFIEEILKYLFFITQARIENKIRYLIDELEIARPDVFKKEAAPVRKITQIKELLPKPQLLIKHNNYNKTKTTKQKLKTKTNRKNINIIVFIYLLV
ncbi:MAG: hypothetical protein V4629_04715 [Pseudomonadota bacterium]